MTKSLFNFLTSALKTLILINFKYYNLLNELYLQHFHILK